MWIQPSSSQNTVLGKLSYKADGCLDGSGQAGTPVYGPVSRPRNTVSKRPPNISPILGFWTSFNPEMQTCHQT